MFGRMGIYQEGVGQGPSKGHSICRVEAGNDGKTHSEKYSGSVSEG